MLLALAILALAALGGAEKATAAVSWAPAGESISAGVACDPCAYVWVVRNGSGRVTSNIQRGTSASDGPIDCGSICQGDFYSWEISEVILTARDGTFLGWEDCPEPDGTRCAVALDGLIRCIKATFTGGGSAGVCPPPGQTPPPPGSGPQTPPPPSGGGLPGAGTTCRVMGSAGPDVLNGTAFDDKICGGGGNDVINGAGGDDYLNGGGGNDRISGGDGRDRLVGGAANDRLSGGAGNDALDGQAGGDALLGDRGNDRLDGGPGRDSFSGGAGNDSLVSRDRLKETVNGGGGRDRARADKTDRLKAVERRF